MQSEIKRIQAKFRNLSDWTIEYDDVSEYKSQSCICADNKRATIYEGENTCGEDYLFHEMLHIAIRESSDREKEEILVQDLCVLFTDHQAALSAAEDENRRLREALGKIATIAGSYSRNMYTCRDIEEIAREALGKKTKKEK